MDDQQPATVPTEPAPEPIERRGPAPAAAEPLGRRHRGRHTGAGARGRRRVRRGSALSTAPAASVAAGERGAGNDWRQQHGRRQATLPFGGRSSRRRLPARRGHDGHRPRRRRRPARSRRPGADRLDARYQRRGGRHRHGAHLRRRGRHQPPRRRGRHLDQGQGDEHGHDVHRRRWSAPTPRTTSPCSSSPAPPGSTRSPPTRDGVAVGRRGDRGRRRQRHRGLPQRRHRRGDWRSTSRSPPRARATRRARRLTGLIEISSDVISGDSGGATYDAEGEVRRA